MKLPTKLICGILHHQKVCEKCGGKVWTQPRQLKKPSGFVCLTCVNAKLHHGTGGGIRIIRDGKTMS